MATESINYAKVSGIHTVAGAVVFAILYVPLLGFFTLRSLQGLSSVLKVLTVFCAVRVAAFVIRAVLAGIDGAGQNLDLLTADEVLLGVGYFGLLYAAYTLVLDRIESLGIPPPRNIISVITRNRVLVRLAMGAAVALGIAGATMTSPDNLNTGLVLRRASTIIFLALTVLQAFQTYTLISMERSASPQFASPHLAYGKYVLLIVSVLMLIREAYYTATVGKITKAANEKTWYPLFALPELLAVALYTVPGIIPTAVPDDIELQSKQLQF